MKILIFFLLLISSTFQQDEPNYRLPKNVIPTKYSIHVILEEDSFDTKLFRGDVTISLYATEPTNIISLHSSGHQYDVIELDGIEPVERDVDETTEILTLTFEENLQDGLEYHLHIAYTGPFSDVDMYGFYQSSYTDEDGLVRYLAATQFEPVYARRAFPSFDEPGFKATFDIIITSPRGFNLVSSNTEADGFAYSEDGTVVTIFQTTPKMSTYLVAFLISNFISDASPYDDTFHVLHKEGSKVSEVLDLGPKILTALSNYTAIEYSSNLNKMDVAAVPDFAFGAMENWGLVTYREVVLLDDGEETSESVKQNIATTVAHEFSHQWFGDLVTLDWWTDLWLNEGFATYFENYVTDLVVPEYEMVKQSILQQKLPILVTDGLRSAWPLSATGDINDPTVANNQFGDITYDKGGNVIRMISQFLDVTTLDGVEEISIFQFGLRKYLANETLKYSNVNPTDLLTNFDNAADLSKILPANKSMVEVLQDWIYSAGYPVITVNLTADNQVTLSQERFLYDINGNEYTTEWYVPISYISKTNKNETRSWLIPDEDLSLPLPENDWILINNEATGYYRVNYEQELWLRIINQLKNDSSSISELNKVQLIDDIFNLARANKVPYSLAFDLSDYLAQETNFYAWASAFSSFSYLLKRTGDSSLADGISSKILNLLQNLYEENSPEDLKQNHIGILNQAQALSWACKLGQEDCRNFAVTSYRSYITSDRAPNSNFRSFIYCTALRNSEDRLEWEFLWRKYVDPTTSVAEQNVILGALGCSRDEDILNDFLEKSITDGSGIRKQDALTAFRSVYSGNPKGVDLAYQFLKDNYEAIDTYYKGANSISSLVKGIADLFTTQQQVDDLKDFLETEGLSEDFKIAGEQAIEQANLNLDWFQYFEDQLNEIFEIE